MRWPSGKAALPGADRPSSPRFTEAQGTVALPKSSTALVAVLVHRRSLRFAPQFTDYNSQLTLTQDRRFLGLP